MSPKRLISASILSADFSCLAGQIAEAEAAGADWIHVDVMDGHFVPNLTVGPLIVEACRRVTHLPIDVHLMVESPDNLLEAFAQAGSNIISVHAETCSDLKKTVQTVHDLGCQSGVVIKPATPVDIVLPFLPIIDLVLVLSVNPGFAGQAFMPEVLPKVSDLKRHLQKQSHHTWIEIDGGINASTLPLALSAGAEVFVAASAIFKHPQGITAGIKQLKSFL
jgi:ribulose-phosphate 3-epimerase